MPTADRGYGGLLICFVLGEFSLAGVEFVVSATEGEELVVGASFDDFACF